MIFERIRTTIILPLNVLVIIPAILLYLTLGKKGIGHNRAAGNV